jgi:hypothetical protein
MENSEMKLKNFSYKFGTKRGVPEKSLIEQIEDQGFKLSNSDVSIINELNNTWNVIVLLLKHKLITYSDRDKIMRKQYTLIKNILSKY